VSVCVVERGRNKRNEGWKAARESLVRGPLEALAPLNPNRHLADSFCAVPHMQVQAHAQAQRLGGCAGPWATSARKPTHTHTHANTQAHKHTRRHTHAHTSTRRHTLHTRPCAVHLKGVADRPLAGVPSCRVWFRSARGARQRPHTWKGKGGGWRAGWASGQGRRAGIRKAQGCTEGPHTCPRWLSTPAVLQ
jgi:hypothetical protein